MRYIGSWLLALGLLLGGCSCGGPSGGVCGYGGALYSVGSSFPASDGCNTCTCLAGGSVACTEKACLVVPDCGGGGGVPDQSCGLMPDLASSDAGSDVVMCGTSPIVFPSFDKTCSDSSQCSFGTHQINCCGSQLAIGFNVAEASRFATDEKQCRSQYPPCACPASPTKTEDGQTWDGVKTIVATCTAKGCMTTLK